MRLATALGWSYDTIDRLTLPEVYELFQGWLEHPPLNELAAAYVGYERPLTIEEKIEQGAMGPADFLKHYQKTGGRLPGDARGGRPPG